MPLAFTSSHTKSPRLAGLKNPASISISVIPLLKTSPLKIPFSTSESIVSSVPLLEKVDTNDASAINERL